MLIDQHSGENPCEQFTPLSLLCLVSHANVFERVCHRVAGEHNPPFSFVQQHQVQKYALQTYFSCWSQHEKQLCHFVKGIIVVCTSGVFRILKVQRDFCFPCCLGLRALVSLHCVPAANPLMKSKQRSPHLLVPDDKHNSSIGGS